MAELWSEEWQKRNRSSLRVDVKVYLEDIVVRVLQGGQVGVGWGL